MVSVLQHIPAVRTDIRGGRMNSVNVYGKRPDAWNRYKDMMAELRAQKESDEAVCDNFYKGYCGKYQDGCFHQCEREEGEE